MGIAVKAPGGTVVVLGHHEFSRIFSVAVQEA
jgi:hypothetical protein